MPDDGSNIVSLRGSQIIIPNQPVEGVIIMLTDLLERAQRGDIQAVAFAIITGSLKETARIKFNWYDPGGHTINLIAATSVLNHRLSHAVSKDLEDG